MNRLILNSIAGTSAFAGIYLGAWNNGSLDYNISNNNGTLQFLKVSGGSQIWAVNTSFQAAYPTSGSTLCIGCAIGAADPLVVQATNQHEAANFKGQVRLSSATGTTTNDAALYIDNQNTGAKENSISANNNGLLLASNGANITMSRTTSAIGLGSISSPTAQLHVPASTTSIASLRIVAGVAPTTPNDGDLWHLSSDHRYHVWLNGSDFTIGNGTINTIQNAGTPITTGTVINFSTGTTATYNSGTGAVDVTASGSSGVLFTSTANSSAVANTTTSTTIIGTGVGSLTIPANSLQVGQKITLTGFLQIGTDGSTTSINWNPTIGGSGPSGNMTLSSGLTSATNCKFTITWVVLTTGSSGSALCFIELNPITTSIGTPLLIENASATTINTTTTLAMDLKFQWGSASTGNTITGSKGIRLKVD